MKDQPKANVGPYARKPYRKPTLKTYGKIHEVTTQLAPPGLPSNAQ